MNTVLIVTDTVHGKIMGDSLMVGGLHTDYYGKAANAAASCSNSAIITVIICATVLLLAISVMIFLYLRNKNEYKLKISTNTGQSGDSKEVYSRKKEEDVEKEKAKYREALVKYLELRALGITENDKVVYHFNEDNKSYDIHSKNYIKELISLINDLKPLDVTEDGPKKTDGSELNK